MFTKKNLKDRLTTVILAGLMSTSSIIPSITSVHAEEETTSHQTVFLFKEKMKVQTRTLNLQNILQTETSGLNLSIQLAISLRLFPKLTLATMQS